MASATMSQSMVSNIQSLISSQVPIPIITPFGESATESSMRDRIESGAGASTAAAASGPSWGWGQDSGFWAGKAGAPVNRGSAGGVRPENTARSSLPPQLEHVCVTETKRHHTHAVRRVIHALDAQRVIVFMNFQDRLRDAMFKLKGKGLTVAVLHGELGKQQRQAIMDGFRTGKYRVLLVSDVVCRGLDVADCDTVINLELPSNAAHYAHRAGRTGRMGRFGTVVSILEKPQQYVVDSFSRALGVKMHAGKISGGQLTTIIDGKVRLLGTIAREVDTQEKRLGSKRLLIK